MFYIYKVKMDWGCLRIQMNEENHIWSRQVLVANNIYIYIGLFGKFMPILKENWNAEDLNF